MPIPDLLWACPICGRDRGLQGSGRAFACHACGTRYRRGRGAEIRARRTDGREEARSPADWVDRLPDPESLLDRSDHRADLRSARVTARAMTGYGVARSGGRFLNRIERFGPPRGGTLRLSRETLRLEPTGGAGKPVEWDLGELTAVQTSSGTLQVNAPHRPLHSFRFHDDSIFLWELLLREALRACYRDRGRGRISEFQPRIAIRP